MSLCCGDTRWVDQHGIAVGAFSSPAICPTAAAAECLLALRPGLECRPVCSTVQELAGTRQGEAHLARPWRGPPGAGAPQLYHTVSTLESLAALHTFSLSHATPTAQQQQQQQRKAARAAPVAAASGEQHPASSGGVPAGAAPGCASGAAGLGGVEAELLLRRTTDLHHELQFLMQQAEDHAAACLAAALAAAEAAEAAAEAAARGRGRRGGGNSGSGGRAAAVTAAQLAVRVGGGKCSGAESACTCCPASEYAPCARTAASLSATTDKSHPPSAPDVQFHNPLLSRSVWCRRWWLRRSLAGPRLPPCSGRPRLRWWARAGRWARRSGGGRGRHCGGWGWRRGPGSVWPCSPSCRGLWDWA